MYVLFQVQWVVVILLTCYTVAHAAPKRSRSVPAPTVEHEGHDRYGDLDASFQAWEGAQNRKRNTKMTMRNSVMARYLLEAWGFGVKSAHEVQREAAMAVADGACLPDLVKLAGLGTAEHDEDVGYMRATNPGNIERDLRRAVKTMTKGKIANLPKGSMSLPMQVTKGPKQGWPTVISMV